MIVSNQGTEDGMSCERAAMIKAAYKGREKSKIQCDDNGLCTEHRPCRLKCSDVARVTSAAAVRDPSKGEICDNSWSACDSSCMQTRVVSELWSDDVCHEKSRTTRPCHTGACAKSNPCHVPYVVRAVLAFSGGSAGAWTRDSDEKLASALVASVGDAVDQEHDIFGSGDVNVVKISPLPSDGDKERLKVSIEISIVNPDPLSLSDAESSAKSKGIFSTLFTKSFVKTSGLTDESKCDNSALYPLARSALNVKQMLEGDLLKEEVEAALGLKFTEVIASTVVSGIQRDDTVNLIGSFTAGLHTHRLRQYASQRPFMTFLFCCSVTLLVFGTCVAFELLVATLFQKSVKVSAERDPPDIHDLQINTSILSSEGDETQQLMSASFTVSDDELSQNSEKSGDDMLDRLLQRATCTPPRKLKAEGASTPSPTFDPLDRIMSRGSSPRKRKVERYDTTESDLEMAGRTLEYGHK